MTRTAAQSAFAPYTVPASEPVRTEKPSESTSFAPAGHLRLETMNGDRWDQLASGFEDALHEQSHVFNAARWSRQNIENVAFFEGVDCIGGASVVLIRAPLTGTGMAIVKWGPLWRRRGETADPVRLGRILAGLQAEYAERRGMYLTIMPPACIDHAETFTRHLETLGFCQGSALPAPERYLVDVSRDEEAQRKSLSQKWRYNLKKSERHEFDISVGDSPEAHEAFTGLYAAMLKRKQFNDSSAIRTLGQLMQGKSAAFRPQIVLLSHDGRLTAGAVIDMSGDQAAYLYGATDERALALNAGYALHWHITGMLSRMPGMVRYDLGGNDLDRGLHQFKKGFVGKNGHICTLPPSYHYSSTLRARVFGKMVFALRDVKHAISQRLNRQA